MTHVSEETLVAYALDDVATDDRHPVEAHVEVCAECRVALDEIRATLAAAQVEVPDRGAEYGAEVWSRLEGRLTRETRDSAPARLRSVAPWLAAAAALLLALGAYWLGRYTAAPTVPQQAHSTPALVPSPGPSPAAASESIHQRVVLAALGEHLDRTERTLVELVNSQSGGRIDISAEQRWARDLLEANRLYRRASGSAASPALSQVLEDLEPVLLEIANSASQITSEEFEALRGRIEARSLVFKVRVSGADVRARERALILRQAQDAPGPSTGIRRGELQS